MRRKHTVLANLAITGNFSLASGGSINLYANTGVSPTAVSTITDTGTIGINLTGTTLSVTFVGGGAPSTPLNVMTATVSISNVAATNPAGWTASISGGDTYVLTNP